MHSCAAACMVVVVQQNSPSSLSSIFCKSKKLGCSMAHRPPNFSRNAHITAKFASFTHLRGSRSLGESKTAEEDAIENNSFTAHYDTFHTLAPCADTRSSFTPVQLPDTQFSNHDMSRINTAALKTSSVLIEVRLYARFAVTFDRNGVIIKWQLSRKVVFVCYWARERESECRSVLSFNSTLLATSMRR